MNASSPLAPVRWFSGFAALAPFAWPAAFLAVLLIVGALSLALVLGRRSFYRRNIACVEEFESYSHAVLTNLGEGLVDLLGRLMLLAGVACAMVAFLGFMAASGK